WFAPWERQRQTRILNGLTEAGLRVAALDPQTAAALLDSWSPNANDRQRGWLHSCGLPLLDPADARTTTARWLPLLVGSKVAEKISVETLEQRVQDGLAQCRRQAAQLKTALMLYQTEHQGQSAPDLEALVTLKILHAVPLDPFDGRPFRYRLSDG